MTSAPTDTRLLQKSASNSPLVNAILEGRQAPQGRHRAAGREQSRSARTQPAAGAATIATRGHKESPPTPMTPAMKLRMSGRLSPSQSSASSNHPGSCGTSFFVASRILPARYLAFSSCSSASLLALPMTLSSSAWASSTAVFALRQAFCAFRGELPFSSRSGSFFAFSAPLRRVHSVLRVLGVLLQLLGPALEVVEFALPAVELPGGLADGVRGVLQVQRQRPAIKLLAKGDGGIALPVAAIQSLVTSSCVSCEDLGTVGELLVQRLGLSPCRPVTGLNPRCG